MDFGNLLNELSAYGKAHVSDLLADFQRAVRERASGPTSGAATAGGSGGGDNEEVVQF